MTVEKIPRFQTVASKCLLAGQYKTFKNKHKSLFLCLKTKKIRSILIWNIGVKYHIPSQALIAKSWP